MLTRAHGVFSAAVVVGSLVTGGLQLVGVPVVVAFGLVLLVASAAAVPLRVVPAVTRSTDPGTSGRPGHRWSPLVVVGVVAALAFAVENAHQSWGAVFLADQLHVGGGLTAAAPAVFAAVAATTRFGIGALPPLPAGPLLLGGAAGAAVGSWVLWAATATPVALLGLALAAAGTAVLAPTLLREAVRDVPDDVRGRATSVVVSTGYAGFVLGPAVVGLVAQAGGLRMAFAAVAAGAAVVGVVAWPVVRWAAHGSGAQHVGSR